MKKYILILMIATLAVSCSVDEFLDVKPTGTVIPELVEHFDKLLEDPDIGDTTWRNLLHMDPDFFVTEEGYDRLVRRAEFYRQKQYKWLPETREIAQTDFGWRNRYINMYTYNDIIANIGSAELGNRSETDRKRVWGEAHASRAFDLFLLVNEYAPHISSTTLDAPAIPMPLITDILAQLPRSTVGEVYDQIFSDLAIAQSLSDNLPSHNIDANFRASKAGLKGLFALVHLYAGNFEEAKTFSNEALDLYDFVYDYTEFTHKTPGEPWSGLTGNIFEDSEDVESIVWSRMHNPDFWIPAALYNPDLAALFDQANDQRWLLFSHDEDRDGTSGVAGPGEYFYASFNAETNAGITVPNLILVNAEAKARTGDNQGALDALNSLLVKRILNFTPLTLANTPDVLQKVKDERRKELMRTGNNMIDLKRYHAYGETVPTFTRDIDGETFTLAPGSQEYVVPISAEVRSSNPNL